jgi:glycerophosphoryl diester phosphodiesterase
MDVGTWFNLRHPALARTEYARAGIPTLAGIFERLGAEKALLYVELKCGPEDREGLAEAVAALVGAHSLAARVVVESFDLDAIALVKRMDSGIRTAALFDRRLSRPLPLTGKMIEQARACGAQELALHHSLATRRAVREAGRHGLETVVWTADNPAWVERAIEHGIHAIITNDPARLSARRALTPEWIAQKHS